MINARPYISGDSIVAISTRLRDWRLSTLGSVLGRGNGFFSSPKHPDRLWCPPSVLYNDHRKLFPLW
jgi:hypothetical protein